MKLKKVNLEDMSSDVVPHPILHSTFRIMLACAVSMTSSLHQRLQVLS